MKTIAQAAKLDDWARLGISATILETRESDDSFVVAIYNSRQEHVGNFRLNAEGKITSTIDY